MSNAKDLILAAKKKAAETEKRESALREADRIAVESETRQRGQAFVKNMKTEDEALAAEWIAKEVERLRGKNPGLPHWSSAPAYVKRVLPAWSAGREHFVEGVAQAFAEVFEAGPVKK